MGTSLTPVSSIHKKARARGGAGVSGRLCHKLTGERLSKGILLSFSPNRRKV